MSKHDEIAEIVEKYCGELAEYSLSYNNKRYWAFYSYKAFPTDKKSNLLKFDKNLFEADMVAMYSIDNGVINPDAEKCKDGIVFMLSGFYIRTAGQLKGYTFIKYSAIDDIEVKGKKELHLTLNVQTNDFWKQDYLDISIDYYAEPLKKILTEIIEIDRKTDTSYTTESQTGIVKGIIKKIIVKHILKVRFPVINELPANIRLSFRNRQMHSLQIVIFGKKSSQNMKHCLMSMNRQLLNFKLV